MRGEGGTNPLSLAVLDSSFPFLSPGGRGRFRDEPSQSPTATALPRGEPLAKRAGFVLTGQRQKKPADKRKTFRLCQSLSLSGEVARRSRDGEGCFRDEPLPSFRFAKCHLPRRWRPGQRGQVSSSPVNGRKKPAVKQQTFRPCQSLSLSGEVARQSRDGEGRFQNSLSPSAAGSSCRCIVPPTNTKSPPESSPAGF